jgi:fatty acid desaturase
MTSSSESGSRSSKWVFWLSVVAVYTTLLLALALATRARADGSFALALLGFLAIGWLQYVLIQAMHEACHQLRSGLGNHLAAVLLFYAIGLTRAYRRIHFAHHAHFNSFDDPDYPAYHAFPRSRGELLGTLLRHASGLAVAQQLREQNVGETGQSHPSHPADRVGMPLVQLGILGAFSALSSPLDYGFFWLIPLITVTKVLGYLRILAEHGDPHGVAAIRSFRCNPLAGAILGPYGFTRHAEHHAWASVPFSQLSGYEVEGRRPTIEAYATRHAAHVDMIAGSHFVLLAKWWRELPNRVPA